MQCIGRMCMLGCLYVQTCYQSNRLTNTQWWMDLCYQTTSDEDMCSLLDVTTVVFMAIALSLKDKAAEKETIKY